MLYALDKTQTRKLFEDIGRDERLAGVGRHINTLHKGTIKNMTNMFFLAHDVISISLRFNVTTFNEQCVFENLPAFFFLTDSANGC